jgi:four helix bundle protein
VKFFNIASASLSEVTYGIHAAFRLGYIDENRHQQLDEITRMVAAPLGGLIRHHRGAGAVKAIVPAVTLLLLLGPMVG